MKNDEKTQKVNEKIQKMTGFERFLNTTFKNRHKKEGVVKWGRYRECMG